MACASATILSLTGACALYLTHKRATVPATMRHIGAGMLIAVFTAAFAMPAINEYAGFGQLCGKAAELSRTYHVEDFCSWHMRHAAKLVLYNQQFHNPSFYEHHHAPRRYEQRTDNDLQAHRLPEQQE